MIKTLSRMIHTGILTETAPHAPQRDDAVRDVHGEIWKILGRALCIRHVDAGSCNGCELEIQALNNPYYNIEGIGIKFVASPRHADLLLVTGPVSVNMEEALKRTFLAAPDPKLVVAVGDCGACGGMFRKSYASRGSIADVIPVDCTVPGCPPSPVAIVEAILRTVRASGHAISS
jgi:Ni,Fe-hydrogenase III small subunit